MSYRLHPTKNKNLPESETRRHWYVESYPNGRKGGMVRVQEFCTEAEIRIFEAEIRKAARPTTPAINPQFNSAVPDFLEYYALEHRPRAVERVTLSIQHLRKHFGPYPLNAVSGPLVAKYKTARIADGVKHKTVNLELNALNSMLAWAAESELIAPAAKVKLFSAKLVKSPVADIPDVADLERVVHQVRPEVKGLAMLMYYCGLRRNEAMLLKAENCYLQKGLILVEGKGGKERFVPVVNAELLEELELKIEAVGGEGPLWLNPMTGKPYVRISAAIKAAAIRAGVDKRCYNHLLRHGFTTACFEQGMEAKSISLILGHTTTRITEEIYTHVSVGHLKNQLERHQNAIPLEYRIQENSK